MGRLGIEAILAQQRKTIEKLNGEIKILKATIQAAIDDLDNYDGKALGEIVSYLDDVLYEEDKDAT